MVLGDGDSAAVDEGKGANGAAGGASRWRSSNGCNSGGSSDGCDGRGSSGNRLSGGSLGNEESLGDSGLRSDLGGDDTGAAEDSSRARGGQGVANRASSDL